MSKHTPDPRFAPDLRRLERAILALEAAKTAAAAGMLFASEEGLVAVQATRGLWQSDCLETTYREIWLEAGCPTSDEIDDRVRALSARTVKAAA